MPKSKLKLSKKHEYLIDKLCEIPVKEDINKSAFVTGKIIDYRYNTEDILLMIIEEITRNTQLEDVGKEISEKARNIFDYYSDKKSNS